MYSVGFRVGKFGVGRVGTVELTVPLVNTDVFVDKSQKITTDKDNQKISITLSPTTHQIIVSRAGYFPWTKKIDVQSLEVVTLSPIFVAQNSGGEYITVKDPQYYTIRNSITSSVLSTKESPKISGDKNVRIWVENNVIVAKVGEEIRTVLAPEETITSLDFYKGRTDAVLFSAGEGVFVIETDPNKDRVQNIMPIFKGTNPRFVVNNNDSMYVLNGTSLMALSI